MTNKYLKRKFWLIFLIILLIFVIGCTNQDTDTEKNKSDKTQISEALTAEEYPNAVSGGTFSVNDKIEYLGVKGVIVTGKIENGIVTLEPLQINDESLPVNDSKAPLLVYGSFDHPTYGHMAMVHYVQRGGGEYELYDNSQLVATMKIVEGYSRNAYIVAACEPDSQPEFAEQLKSIVIKRYIGCS